MARFEQRRRWTPVGGYTGLAIAELRADHYLREGRARLLGCRCGDAGCWPLEARIVVTPGTVRWEDFRQPHRPEWDYDGFGPFSFPRPGYERAVREGIQAATAGT